MSIKEAWINLPVNNLSKSKAFYTAIGLKLNLQNGNTDNSACFLTGSKNVVLILFQDVIFKSFSQNELTDTSKSSEVLFSFDAESRTEIDELAKTVASAGGTIFSEVGEVQGWIYGFGFRDPDGHRWNLLYMDFEKIPKQ